MDLATGEAINLGSQPRREFHLASLGLRPETSFATGSPQIARWRSGRIVVEDGWLASVCGRWWPYRGSFAQAYYDMRFRPLRQDRCELYYHQPWSSPDFLALSYVRSGPATTLSTFYLATLALEEVAKLKRSSAIVCQVTNDRITDRLFQRWGWQQHCLDWPGRHFIKRFYGNYPPIAAHWKQRLRIN